jgi:hypothetical protein
MAATKLILVPPTETQKYRASLCDDFGELKRLDDANKLAHAPTAARLKLITEIIQSWVPSELAGDQDASFEGSFFTVTASIRTNETKVTSMAKLFKFLSATKFFLVCKIGVGALEENIGKAMAASWLVKDRTGYRTITAVAKAQSDKAA